MMKLEEIFSSEELEYNRSIKIPQPVEFVPVELRRLNTIVIERVEKVLDPEIRKVQNELRHYIPDRNDGFIHDVEEYEHTLRGEFQDVVDENADTGPIVKDIKKLIKKYDGKANP